MYDDTIVAIATPPGRGGLGVVRLSGREAWRITGELFTGRLADHRAVYGTLRDGERGEMVDEAMVTAMAAPQTYTREDVVEISCHGSPVVLQRVVALALRHGARLASPGEFTLRAFLHGRIDLAQAESVLDVIQAQTEAGLRQAVDGLRGRLSGALKEAQDVLLGVQAYLTACIDFPEDEVESQAVGDPKDALERAAKMLQDLKASAGAGMVYRNGVATAIIGRPNVGKSSLLNRLLGEERAIVTPMPGTTRDTVEETANIRGIPFRLIDTAGLRSTEDAVERMGMERSRRAMERADVLLLVVDGSMALTDEDTALLAAADGRPTVVAANKCDLARGTDLSQVKAPVACISALTGEGMDGLAALLESAALGGKAAPSDAPLVTNPRHAAALERALASVTAAQRGLRDGLPQEMVTIDLSAALEALGEITGQGVHEALLDTIFSQFCVGK
ncbi:MAG: tRNA uridine-5-carboxymethylaminomethyl(34) synthesis GTPase MnmE [Dehalococcoidia bacterium]|nr:tRNA uridine-5-carboxymethylaminomethyl(34) synthesis GTPase MnmE [Dehalococcoidia bacterium]